MHIYDFGWYNHEFIQMVREIEFYPHMHNVDDDMLGYIV